MRSAHPYIQERAGYKWLFLNSVKNNKILLIFLILINIFCGILQSEKILLVQKLVMLVQGISAEKICFCLIGIFLICVINDIKNPLCDILYLKFQQKIYDKYWNIISKKLEKISILKFDEYDFIIDLDRAKKTINSYICDCVKQIMALISTFSILSSLVYIIANTDITYIILFGVLSVIQNTVLLLHTRHTAYFMKDQDKLWHKEKYYKDLLQSRKSLKEIRIYNCGKWIFNKRISNFNYIKEEHIKFSQKWSSINIVSGFIMYLIEGGIFLYMFFELSQGTKNVGEILLLIQAQELFCNSIFSFLEIVTGIKQDLFYVQSFLRIINEDENRQMILLEENKAIKLKDIIFGYNNGGKIIDKISLNFNKGEKVVLVGENGSGKSTLAKILAGLLEVDAGEISYSNSKITAIFQDFSRFNISIGENIWFENNEIHRNDFEEKQVKKTCQFIDNFSDEFDTLVGPELYENGIEMSGGQWQQIGIMRAIVEKAEVIIFDEPTAALDPISEQEYFHKLEDLLENKTVILITHRIGLAKFGEKICFIEKGKIVEEGNYYDLLKRKAKFYEYYKTQMKWYE